MLRTQLLEEDYIRFFKTRLFGNIDDPVEAAIKSSYLDVCRTISGFSKNKNHDEILENAEKILHEEIDKMLSKKITNPSDFNKWHKNCCKKLKEVFGSQIFNYGQAQKWINMSLKNLSMLDHKRTKNNYEFFHIPIDNLIMKETEKKMKDSWSKIDDYDEYLEYQKNFRKHYSGIPLDNEFKLWLDAKRKEDNNEKRRKEK